MLDSSHINNDTVLYGFRAALVRFRIHPALYWKESLQQFVEFPFGLLLWGNLISSIEAQVPIS